MSAKPIVDRLEQESSRRRLLRSGGMAALAAGVATACKGDSPRLSTAKTTGMGNQHFVPVMDNGVSVFEITAKKIKWETEPGHLVEASRQ